MLNLRRLGLSTSETKAYLATLADSHRIRLEVDLLDRDEKVIESLTLPQSKVLDGAVEGDARADVTRSLRMEILDPDRALHLDSDSPRRGAMFAENFLAVRYGVEVPDVGWVDVPVFWGPLTELERTGARVSIEAQGKEVLGLEPHYAGSPYTLPKGMTVGNAIRNVMDRVGENRYDLPELRKRLPRARAVQAQDEPWDVVKFGWDSTRKVWRKEDGKKRRKRIDVTYGGLISLAGNYRLFYDGRGRLCAKGRPANPVFVFRGKHLLTAPTVTFDVLTARNRIVVIGAKVQKGKKPNRRQVQMRGRAVLKSSHPLSPWRLRRNGKRRYMTEFVEAENLKTKNACERRAERELRQRSRDGVDVSFECLPIPHLEELDTVRVDDDDVSVEFPLERWTLPLVAGEPMRVGWASDE